jgi:hypothetical protein
MNRFYRFSFVLMFAGAAIGAGCGGDERPDRTGIAQVDAVIEAAEAQDGDALMALLRFQSLPCTDEIGAGGGPKCDGEPVGTAVDVFPGGECEPAWWRRDEAGGLLDEVIALDPALYAAFESPEGFYLDGRYAAVFEGDEPRTDEPGLKRYLAVGVEADSGLITGMALGCGIEEPVHFLLPHRDQGFDAWLIEPPD